MSSGDRLRILRATKDLAGWTDAHLAALLPFIDEVCVPAGTMVAEAGRFCHQLVIVATGELETCRAGRPGRLGPGDAVGWEAMRERGVHDATVRSVSDAHVLVLSHQQFRAVEGLAPATRPPAF